MRARRARVFVALDATSVSGASVSGGMGAPRIRSFAHAPLSDGALVPGPVEPNVVRREEVQAALAAVARELEVGRAPVSLILPVGVSRTVLLEAPAGVAPRDFARYRLAAGLPYAPEEALVDVLPVAGGLLAAAVRKSVIEGYEAAAEASGLELERLDLTPLAALSALAAEARGTATSVDVVLGDRAVALAAWHGGLLRAFRSRLRAPGPLEPDWLAREVDRTAALAGNGGPPRVRVVGSGAIAVLRAWHESGRSVEPGWRAEGALPVDAAELAWLGAALA